MRQVRSYQSNTPGSFLSNRCYKNLTPPLLGWDCFVYDTKAAERQGKELLLALWAKLLETFAAHLEKTVLSAAQFKTVCDLILALVGRYEFDLIHLPLPQRGSRTLSERDSAGLDEAAGGPLALSEDMKAVRRYQSYLAQSVRLSLRAMHVRTRAHSAPHRNTA
jgi:hypothetical protein